MSRPGGLRNHALVRAHADPVLVGGHVRTEDGAILNCEWQEKMSHVFVYKSHLYNCGLYPSFKVLHIIDISYFCVRT